jgi:glycosyltransferase involved in cell wall biosynthesis
MIHYSVLIPQRDAADAIGRILPQLCRVLHGLILPYEIICIDDASADRAASSLEDLLDEYAPLRVLRFDQPRGIGAALSAGVAAARGDLVIAVDPRAARSTRYIPQLIARLSQHDLVIARHDRPLGEELWQRVARAGRLLAARPELLPSEDLLWAARREAVGGLALARGAFRILGKIVSRRGFRVCRLLLADGLPPQGATYRAGIVDSLAGFWLDRRFEPHLASEMVRFREPATRMVPARYDAARPRYVPQPVFTPLDKPSGDSA